jgi:hypothetical protein
VELLRLYDNVPLLAQAQTLMGNRLMYGNYIENYNLVDVNNIPIKFEYETELISEIIGREDLQDTFGNVGYTFGFTTNVSTAQLIIDLDGVDLVLGALISIDASFVHNSFEGNTPSETTATTEVIFSYVLPQNFNSVYELATSVDFQEK